MQAIPYGTKVWVSTVAPRPGVVTRDTQYAGTVLRQNRFETTWYPVRLENGNIITVNDSMLKVRN